jgi:YycE-like protein
LTVQAHLRIARPTDRLAEVERQYIDGLGFERLGGFADHDGFDGVMLGHKGAGYHLEFTQEIGVPSDGRPSTEHLLVFYLPDSAAWQAACARVSAAGWQRELAHNPYWEKNGATFADADGYRVVLQNAASPV